MRKGACDLFRDIFINIFQQKSSVTKRYRLIRLLTYSYLIILIRQNSVRFEMHSARKFDLALFCMYFLCFHVDVCIHEQTYSLMYASCDI